MFDIWYSTVYGEDELVAQFPTLEDAMGYWFQTGLERDDYEGGGCYVIGPNGEDFTPPK